MVNEEKRRVETKQDKKKSRNIQIRESWRPKEGSGEREKLSFYFENPFLSASPSGSLHHAFISSFDCC